MVFIYLVGVLIIEMVLIIAITKISELFDVALQRILVLTSCIVVSIAAFSLFMGILNWESSRNTMKIINENRNTNYTEERKDDNSVK